MTVTGTTSPLSVKTFVMPSLRPMICFISLCLELNVDAGRQIQMHQRVHRLRRRLEDVDEALVRADLEMLAALLVHVRRTKHACALDLSRQRHRARDESACALGRLDDALRRL